MNDPDSRWNWLYKIGGAAAFLTAVFLPIQIIVFLVNPPPESVTGWFALFHSSPLVGLLDLDLLLVADQVLSMLVFLALYVALRRANPSFMAIGLTLGLASTVLFIAANPAFAMLSLSGQFATASTDAQKTVLLAAGQALIGTWQGSAFQVSYFIGSVVCILISIVMLQSRLFSKASAYFGILGNTIALGLYVPVIGVYISVFSVVFLWVWYILLGLRLFSLAKIERGALQPAAVGAQGY